MNSNYRNIKFIVGKAGTAKTTTIIDTVTKLVKDHPFKKVAIIAFTHQAINNIKLKLKEREQEQTDCKFDKVVTKTIHSYFQLVPGEEHEYTKRAIQLPDYLFVDEMSMIPDQLMKIIFKLVSNQTKTRCQLILVGDILQLNPINLERKPIDTNLMSKIKDFDCTFTEALLIADHLSNNVFGYSQFPKMIEDKPVMTLTRSYKQMPQQSATKMILRKNFRNNTAVNSIIEDMLKDPANYTKYVFSDWNHIDDYVVISSKYSTLKEVYAKTKHTGVYLLNTLLGYVSCKIGDKMILTESVDKDFVNGDVVEIISNNTIRSINCEEPKTYSFIGVKCLPLLPYNYLTIHKAQGLGFDKVIVVLDNLFEITMLYTAMTRAKVDLKFILLNPEELERLKIYASAFNKLEKLIYEETTEC
jgi:ATP-dependent exoDNAse (exonuclease V) alpha subunit